MGWLIATGPCVGCARLFSFNPHLVPSCSAVTGKREPICQVCVERVNPMRLKNGLEPIVVLPGAYEPSPEDDRDL
jgi:hypothetical protein